MIDDYIVTKNYGAVSGKNSEAIIADTLEGAPEVHLRSTDGQWRFSRWRTFIGSYHLPKLPEPLFVVQLEGKNDIRTWERDCWSETKSYPGAATIVPANMETGWLVDGELDVVTLSLAADDLRAASVLDQYETMRFAFADPFAAAICRQILAQSYTPASGARDTYICALIDALKAHMTRGPFDANAARFPTSAFSAYRIHHIMNRIRERPEAAHSIESLAGEAGVTPSHFCRMFKRATGLSPHQFVLKVRIDRAKFLLEQSDTSMAIISDMLGFTSQSHFTRSFQNCTGQSPSSFRKRRSQT